MSFHQNKLAMIIATHCFIIKSYNVCLVFINSIESMTCPQETSRSKSCGESEPARLSLIQLHNFKCNGHVIPSVKKIKK